MAPQSPDARDRNSPQTTPRPTPPPPALTAVYPQGLDPTKLVPRPSPGAPVTSYQPGVPDFPWEEAKRRGLETAQQTLTALFAPGTVGGSVKQAGEALTRVQEIGQGVLTAGAEAGLEAGAPAFGRQAGPGEFRDQTSYVAGPNANPFSLLGAAGDVVRARRDELPGVDLPLLGRQDLIDAQSLFIPLPGARAIGAIKGVPGAIEDVVGRASRLGEKTASDPRTLGNFLTEDYGLASFKMFITKADERALKAKGYSQAEINAMKPEEAGRILGQLPDEVAEAAAKRGAAPEVKAEAIIDPEVEAAKAQLLKDQEFALAQQASAKAAGKRNAPKKATKTGAGESAKAGDRVDLDEGRIEGGLSARIGAEKPTLGVPGEGAGPAQTPTQQLGAVRYTVDSSKSRSLVRDTLNNEDLPQIFMGKNHAVEAQALAARLNGERAVEIAAQIKGQTVVPKNDPMRKLTNDQLNVLRRMTTDAPELARIDALLGERMLRVAPSVAMQAAVRAIPKDIATQVRRALRSEAGANLHPDLLQNAPGMDAVLRKALTDAKVEVNLANRHALAEALINEQRRQNAKAVAAASKRQTGDPVKDQFVVDLAHIAEDAKSGAPEVDTFNDTVDAILGTVQRSRQFSGNPIIDERVSAVDQQIARDPAQLELGATPGSTTTAEGRFPTVEKDAVQVSHETAEADLAQVDPYVGSVRPSLEGQASPLEDVAAAGAPAPEAQQLGLPETLESVTIPPELQAARAQKLREVLAADAVTGTDDGLRAFLESEGVLPPGGGGPRIPDVGTGGESSGFKFQKPTLKGLLSAAGKIIQSRRIASGDFSAAGSQTFPVLFNHPIAWTKGVRQGWLDQFKNETQFLAEQKRLSNLIESTGLSAPIEEGGLISRVSGNVVTGDEATAGYAWIAQVLGPAVAKIHNIPLVGGVVKGAGKAYAQTNQGFIGTMNAVRTYAYLGSVRFYEWAYRRPLDLTEKQGLMHDIRVITGKGYQFPKRGEAADMVVSAAELANGLGFSPSLAFARFRLIWDTPKAIANVMWDTTHGRINEAGERVHSPRVQDVEFIRGSAGFLASVTAMWAVAANLGLPIDIDRSSPRFGLIDLGKPNRQTGTAVAVASFLGMRTQTYGGHVYLDPGQGVGQDLRLLYRMVSPAFGELPKDQKGNAWNPWQPKFGEDSVKDLLVNYAQNKLIPGLGTFAEVASGHQPDMGDVTENPITSNLLPLWIQDGLSASGDTQPGGALYVEALTNQSPADREKQRLAIDAPDVPGMNKLSSERQKLFDDKVTAAVKTRLDSLVQTPTYLNADDKTKKELIEKNRSGVMTDTKRNLAIEIARTGTPEEFVPALEIALGQSSSFLSKGQALSAVESRLTPEAVKQIDQIIVKKPDDPTVSELIGGKKLMDRWLAAPEFAVGTKSEWDVAAVAAYQLRLLVADAGKRGVTPRADDQILKFYNEQGGPLFTQLYTISGQKNPKAVHPTRVDIQQDPLWQLVSSQALRLDHPNLPAP